MGRGTDPGSEGLREAVSVHGERRMKEICYHRAVQEVLYISIEGKARCSCDPSRVPDTKQVAIKVSRSRCSSASYEGRSPFETPDLVIFEPRMPNISMSSGVQNLYPVHMFRGPLED